MKKGRTIPDRQLIAGKPNYEQCDNKVVSARYSPLTFLPVAIREQFRRFANVYFLIMGGLMFLGTYTKLFDSAISPWTTLGPLIIVISVSLLVEGYSDYKRHLSDHKTNNAECVILRRTDEMMEEKNAVRDMTIIKGKDVTVDLSKTYIFDATVNKSLLVRAEPSSSTTSSDKYVRIAFQKVRRMDIRQGHYVLVKNREMVPADIVLLASSNDQGGAYIETSSIDGETNLKLRLSPQIPLGIMQELRDGKFMVDPTKEVGEEEKNGTSDTMKPSGSEDVSTDQKHIETIEVATKRLTVSSYLGRPNAPSVLDDPNKNNDKNNVAGPEYATTLITEPPNASVHTFSGRISFPAIVNGKTSSYDIPLGADNVILRGAVLRNTEWVIGLAFFTGTDTKLVQNSFKTPSKFSQLDQLINKTVVMILLVLICIVFYLASKAVSVNNEVFEYIFYAGYNKDATEPWPYLPNLDPPKWNTDATYWYQQSLLYLTLLNNFIPLSLYISVEMIQFFMLYLVYADLDLYDDRTNTRGIARTTIISDLGRIQYIFSDKTGTLTQNVMRFKRCSVDGMIFGTPIQRSRPGSNTGNKNGNGSNADDDDAELVSRFHPLRQLLVGRVVKDNAPTSESDKKLTFNAEMFLRVMSLCHTVVVEKDIDKKESIGAESITASAAKPTASLFASKNRANTGGSSMGGTPSGSEHGSSQAAGKSKKPKNSDGAPAGYAYQAESPDEGALVSAASTLYGFQVIARDSSGIRLQCSHPSHFQDVNVTDRLKSKSITLEKLAADTANVEPLDGDTTNTNGMTDSTHESNATREEIWTILAVNKFDSDRKRMSILLRSPPELGSLPILFCKGADSSMLSLEICGKSAFGDANSPQLSVVNEDEESADADGSGKDEWEIAHMLGMQVHLGEFAKEGLRTLVLGMRVLTDVECEAWLDVYWNASTSMQNRDELLSAAASQIERDLHIVGATAIEDKLQNNVPDTIATLAKAGIKLWVLTGDKRETAVEIGYSTAVLTSKMHLTEVPDNGESHVRTQMAMEFIRLIKIGRLQHYQKTALEKDGGAMSLYKKFFHLVGAISFSFGKFYRRCRRSYMIFLASLWKCVGRDEAAETIMDEVAELTVAEQKIMKTIDKRRKARQKAEDTIKAWLLSNEGVKHIQKKRSGDDEDLALASDETPAVFVRAKSAHHVLQDIASSGELSQPELRQLSIAHLTAHQATLSDGKQEDALVDEDTLSLESFMPGRVGATVDFDRRKRTLLEKMFAVDREVRKGRLKKHMTKEYLAELAEKRQSTIVDPANNLGAPRALVIEGAALKHLLGNPDFEEILFAVASSCEAVIACRVSPRQKALLVNLVRQNITPEPITLAIGDGANDVGMIQEAHVGIGISGKEGQQAVNASDFAIAQFRFLETLILIHGRWDFMRLSTVVLFSFYKNAVMAGVIIVYTGRTLYSGTPLFDEWIIAMLNFVAAWPIIFLGFFDRCLSKEYVRNHPEVYQATRENELITIRSLVRWITVCFIHVFTLYYFSVPQQSYGGGVTPAFLGLMRNEDREVPGNGEGGDLKSVGTVTFTSMIFLMAYKVLFETRSMVHGKWPPVTCRTGVGEGFMSRLPYTYIGVLPFSIAFYLVMISLYQLVGLNGPSQFGGFTLTANHVLGTRSLSWMLILFVPIFCMTFDVCGKVFSNMFYPTQTQIHLELESHEKMLAKRRGQYMASSNNLASQTQHQNNETA